jgi:hypothetical protein
LVFFVSSFFVQHLPAAGRPICWHEYKSKTTGKITKNKITKQAGVQNVSFDYVSGQRLALCRKNNENRAGMGRRRP